MFKVKRYIRKNVLCFLTISTLLLFSACSTSENNTSTSKQIENVESENIGETNMNKSQSSTNLDEKILINIEIGENNYTAYLYDNNSSKELLNLMPMTINMNDMNSNEKFFYLDNKLSTYPERVGKISSGDIMLYGSNGLVLFYESFSTPYSYTKLGYIENASGIKNSLGNGSVDITFNKVD